MAYLHQHVGKRTDASALLPGARTVIVFALVYHQSPPAAPEGSGPRGRVAMYAWGDDYHRIMKRKLFGVVDRLREELDEPFDAKVCVDTAPLLEREYALAAGIGWIGKNTLVLNERLGSYLFLGEIVTTLELPADRPAMDHCGNCTRCLSACPTDAFPQPYQMDASRCISYLTIESRDEQLPAETQSPMENWVFGCDVCQQVCPFNRDAPQTREPRFAIREPGPFPDLRKLVAATDGECRDMLKGSAMKRAKPWMLRRNARIALANVAGAPRGETTDG
jgi:epoxyqueuosine reductase